MSILIAPPPPTVFETTRPIGEEQRFLIHNVSWESYDAIWWALNTTHVRIAYLEGTMELMTLGPRHERFRRSFGRMLDLLVLELNIPASTLGSTTFRRQAAQRGVEPDECFYLAQAGRMALAKELTDAPLNLDEVPPPDLVIEVEITSPLLDKLAIYAAMGVPEIWRFDGEILTVLLLQPDGNYLASERSRAFPFLPMGPFLDQLRNDQPADETAWMRSYRDWVREVVAPLARL